MATTTPRLPAILIILFYLPPVFGQPTNVRPNPSPLINAAASGQRVRFSSAADICQIRVQILASEGQVLFDSAWRDGNVLDWALEDAAVPLTSGAYRCVVMVKGLDGQTTEREGMLSVQDGRVSIEQRAGAERLNVVGSDDSGPKVTLLSHDGTNGAIVSTAGDLSFRFGNFLAGKEGERMRLTADGSLGIGTDKPQAPLDVNGLIRTSKGILFPDGTILTSAAGLPRVQEGDGLMRQRPSEAGTANAPGPSGRAAGLRPTFLLLNPPPHPTPRPNTTPAYQFVVGSTGVTIGTVNTYGLSVAGDVTLASNLNLPTTASATAGVINVNGSRFIHSYGNQNTFIGTFAGNFTMTGAANTAIGYAALGNNTSGGENTASGDATLLNNTTGSSNTAIGYAALVNNTNAIGNTGTGFYALYTNTTGQNNTASGSEALRFNTVGYSNTASGYQALWNNSSGTGNVGVGYAAGYNLTTGNYNIDISNSGVAAEGGTIRIGTSGYQTRTFIAGIAGVTTGASAVPVLVDPTGQLGIISSSRRYKSDISDMGDATAGLMELRPVTFRYLAHGNHAPLQYGLIAEEVAKVYPEMVTRDASGEPDAVMYQFLAPMLLNEVQKQQRRLEEQQETIDALSATLNSLVQRLQALEAQRPAN